MQFLEDVHQNKNDLPDNWHFRHINLHVHEPWRLKARKLRKRRMLKLYFNEEQKRRK